MIEPNTGRTPQFEDDVKKSCGIYLTPLYYVKGFKSTFNVAAEHHLAEVIWCVAEIACDAGDVLLSGFEFFHEVRFTYEGPAH